MEESNGKHEPIRQSVHVDCPIDDAFRLFTESFGEWWPLAAGAKPEIEPWEGGKVFERAPSGEERDWGTVLVWDPPRRVEFTWHHFAWHPRESRDDDGQTVNVEFSVEADGTRVMLTHRGWQRSGEPVCASGFARFVSEQVLVMA